jgi:methionyl-tRNA formyltransferase
MRIALLGRTRWLLDAGRLLMSDGHEIGLVATAKPADYDIVNVGDFQRLADEVGAPFLRTASLDTVLADLDHGCDVALSVNWPFILGEQPIRAFPLGILNVHAGDLPRYRGNAVVNWAILNGETRIGLCVHRMVPGEVDSGPVLGRSFLPIDDDTYVGDVYHWLDTAVPALVASVIHRMAANQVVAEDPSGASLRCYPRRPDDGRIDWTQSAEDIRRLVRASSTPFAGAFTTLEDTHTVRIWRADSWGPQGRILAVPGQVLEGCSGDPVIACGDGGIRLAHVSIDGIADDASAKAMILRSLRNRLR